VPDLLLDVQRSLVRLTVVAVALIAAAASFARCAARRTAVTVPPAIAASSFEGTLRDDAERLLEGHPALRGAVGPALCATAYVGADQGAGARRRVFVQALCRELCPVGTVVQMGRVGTAFPAAVVAVARGQEWHAVGFEVPTDAHLERDIEAIFPAGVRQALFADATARAAETRLASRIAARWPSARWSGEPALQGCTTAEGRPDAP